MSTVIGGTRFQCLAGWRAALQLILPAARFTRLEVEASNAGNADDVVLYRPDGSGEFTQVKWAVNGTAAVDERFLLGGSSRPLLRKFLDTYRKLGSREHPAAMRLLTNRPMDAGHPVLGHVDGRSDLLRAVGGGHPDDAEQAVLADWAARIETPVEELVEMLRQLSFWTGRQLTAERTWTREVMQAAGLAHDENALERALGGVERWILAGRRTVFPHDVHALIEENQLASEEPWNVLAIQAIDRMPNPPDSSAYLLDWQDRYAQDVGPGQRIVPLAPGDWSEMATEAHGMAELLAASGARRVLVRGTFRQATAFMLGYELSDVKSFTLCYEQQGVQWRSDAPRTASPQLSRTCDSIGLGTDLAVAVGLARSPRAAVLKDLHARAVPADRLITIEPADGPDARSVAGPGPARAVVLQVRQIVSDVLEELGGRVRRVHLFLAGPNGGALLLGHFWNVMPPTVVHEFRGPGLGYVPAFTVAA
jgi:hypothetical protein